jgi:lipopolysaccharide biosynthesis glycosyltransferase
MLTKPMDKQSFVKCHILVVDVERDVIRKISRMKQPYFDEMIDKVIGSIF